MAAVSDEAMTRALAGIQSRARVRNLTRARLVGRALDAAAGVGDRRWDREAAVTAAHQLAGSAGTFGHWVASERAHELEHYLRDPDPGRVDWARERLAELVDDLNAHPSLDE